MKILYFNCFSGISGDMCLGAFVDTGLQLEMIAQELRKLPINGYQLVSNKVLRCGISSTKVDVLLKQEDNSYQKGREWIDITKIIESSSLSIKLKEKGLQLFKRLFEVEGKIHGESHDTVHLHELGAVDCLVDIFGTLIALELLGVERIYTSEINLGSGLINTSHGKFPIPAPATIELIRGYPVYSSGIAFELTTPTGALIISGLDAIYSPLPKMVIEKIGYGAGNKDIKEMPNVLKILIGEESSMQTQILNEDLVIVIETNIDDMTPQLYEDVMDRLFNAGALDVTLENIIMKKGRPAIKLTVIAYEKDFNYITDILFNDTTTIGIRFYHTRRKTLQREIKRIKTSLGDVRIKISRMAGRVVNISPEYDDILILSKRNNLPLKRLISLILSEIPKDIFY